LHIGNTYARTKREYKPLHFAVVGVNPADFDCRILAIRAGSILFQQEHAAAMSNQASISPPLRASLPADPEFGLLDRLADHLAPLFVTNPDDLPTARLMAVRTIASYRPETQADFINIARTVGFSMSTLAALSRSAAQDMAPALHLRYFGCATAVSRCADQSERARARRRSDQQSGAPFMPSAWMMAEALDPGTATAPENPETDACDSEISGGPAMTDPEIAGPATAGPGIGDLKQADPQSDEAAIEVAVAEAMREYTASRKQAAPVAPTAVNQPRPAGASAVPNTSRAPTPRGIPAQHTASLPPAAPMRHGPRQCEPSLTPRIDQLLEAARQREQLLHRNSAPPHVAG